MSHTPDTIAGATALHYTVWVRSQEGRELRGDCWQTKYLWTTWQRGLTLAEATATCDDLHSDTSPCKITRDGVEPVPHMPIGDQHVAWVEVG